MRTMSIEQLDELRRYSAYRLIEDTRRPDHTVLRRDAERFARWIARKHDKERRAAGAVTA